MDFDLSEEQRLLKESVDGFLGGSYDFDQRKKYMAEKGGWSKAVWSKLAEQGLLDIGDGGPRLVRQSRVFGQLEDEGVDKAGVLWARRTDGDGGHGRLLRAPAFKAKAAARPLSLAAGRCAKTVI